MARALRAADVRIGLFSILVCSAVFGVAGWRMGIAYDLELAEARSATANLARSAADQAHRLVQQAAIVLDGTAERLQEDGFSDASLQWIHASLTKRVADFPDLHHLVVFSSTGDALTASFEPMSPVNVADRAYFVFHRDHADVRPLIGSPVQNRADGHWSLTVSRRIDTLDGRFAGVVVAVVDCETFVRFYSSFDLGKHGTMTLLNRDNIIIARYPAPLNPNYRLKPSVQDWWSRGNTGHGRFTGLIDNTIRIDSFQRVAELPLMAVATLAEADVLEQWWGDARNTVLSCSAISLVLILLSWRLGHQIRQREKREIVVARDLTIARDEADRANQAKSRFLASITHELRTPLNGILGYAQLLRIEEGLSEKQAGRVDAMLVAGGHLLTMINQVLNISEIEAGAVHLQPVLIELEKVALDCIAQIYPAARAKGLDIRCDRASDSPAWLMADPMRLRQVVLNLLSNAVKFTDRGSVELRLLAAGVGGVRIEVADTGPGIAAAKRRFLFEEFERLETVNVEGAGLGLAISARLVQAMAGRIGLDDNPLGGCVFWFELPASLVAGALPALQADAPHAGPRPDCGLSILVADDIEMNREITGAFLRAAGHTVAYARGGAEAAAMAAAEDYSLVLMDVRMPVVDGLEATRRIRDVPGTRGRVPVLALTAQAFADQIQECHCAGMDDHLSKPFTQAALLDAITRLLASCNNMQADQRRGVVAA